MKSDHDEVPVSITHVPSDPCWGVSVEDQRQKDHIGYHHDGAGQYHHQTNKHLPGKDNGESFIQRNTYKLLVINPMIT